MLGKQPFGDSTNETGESSASKTARDIESVLEENSISWKKNAIETIQINLGKLCNQVCVHCHVDAGPNKKRENLDSKVFEKIMELIDSSEGVKTLDLTGGAPELNPYFRQIVLAARSRGIEVIDRCNLTVLWEPGQEDTAQFLAENQVKVVASLPCYSSDNVNKQRGDGVFEKSIKSLKLLNQLGYGKKASLQLDLVYNPLGASLPGDQKILEAQYKKMLFEQFEIVFDQLYCITNMPIKRFLYDLKRQGKYQEYMELLKDNFNPSAAKGVMCLNMVSINWDGTLSDCDFNQMLGMKVKSSVSDIWNLKSLKQLQGNNISTASHCFGCTAGAGSSCGGTLVGD